MPAAILGRPVHNPGALAPELTQDFSEDHRKSRFINSDQLPAGARRI